MSESRSEPQRYPCRAIDHIKPIGSRPFSLALNICYLDFFVIKSHPLALRLNRNNTIAKRRSSQNISFAIKLEQKKNSVVRIALRRNYFRKQIQTVFLTSQVTPNKKVDRNLLRVLKDSNPL